MALSVGKVVTKIFGSRNDRLIKRFRKMVEQINATEPRFRRLMMGNCVIARRNCERA